MQKILIVLLISSISFLTYAQTDKSAQIKEFLLQEEANGYSGTVLVAEKGKVLFIDGIGMADRENAVKQTAQTVFSTGSITKQFTAAAIMKLEAQGKLSVNDPLEKYFPEAPEDKRNISIHQMLTHTAGFPEVLGDDYDTIDSKEFSELALKTPLMHQPGSTYLYSNVGYSMLGIIVRQVSGKGYEEFLHDELFLPSKMLNTGYVLPGYSKSNLAVGYKDGKRWGTAMDHRWKKGGPGWHLRANGGILSTVDDMYKWYVALRNNTFLPKDQTDKMFSPHVAEGPRQITHYGYGWVVERIGEEKIIWHNGGNGVYNAWAGFDLKNDIFIVVSSNANNTISDVIAAKLFNIVSEKAKIHVPAFFNDGFGNHPVTKKILEAIRKNGADYFSQHTDEILKQSGFDFDNDMILSAVGEQLEEAGQWNEGIALYKTYTVLFPRIVVAWNRLGVCYKMKGEKEKAKEAWEKSVSIRPTNNRAVQFLKELE